MDASVMWGNERLQQAATVAQLQDATFSVPVERTVFSFFIFFESEIKSEFLLYVL